MIGINNSPSGDVSAVLAKNYADLDVDSTFAEAFRYCLETLLRKAPMAKVLVILPLKSSGREAAAVPIRQMEREICEYFAVPYTEIYKTCGISPLTFATLMPDGLHPNNPGNMKIERALWPVVRDLMQ
jgi:lysophospholipase L1-like esterase